MTSSNQSIMQEMIESLRSSAEKYELLAAAAQNIESRLHFETQASELRYQAQCYQDCLQALREFAAHLFPCNVFDDVC